MATSLNNNKDTLYVDIDDEITSIIDKVRSSDSRVVALVLPKRATVLQSIVNMKLLKRSAEAAKKHVVLVTTENGLLPLAGAVGLHVAATPQSKPEIPPVTEPTAETDDLVDETSADAETEEGYTAANAGGRTVGDLASDTSAAGGVETVSLPDAADAADSPAPTPPKTAKNKHLKVPNFNKFRARLFIAGLALVLIVFGLYICLSVLPKATVTIATNASDVNVSLTMTLDPGAHTLDTTKMIVPAKAEQQQKTSSQQVATTGQKNTGEKATGTVTMAAQKCSGSGSPDDVPSGTGISTSGLTFITQEKTSFHITGFNNGCGIFAANNTTDVTAQTPGAKYNVSNASFTVAGRADISATGSASGGTDNILQIIAQGDIDTAKQKLAAQDTSAVKSSLAQALRQEGFYPLEATFATGQPTVTNSGNVGDEAANVTVTQAITYTMLGAKKDNLDSLLKSNVSNQIDTHNQSILDDGLGSAQISTVSTSGSAVQLSVQTTAIVGPDLNATDIKKQVAGKKSGDVKKIINQLPGVTDVTVQLSPFWVGSVPTSPDKITIIIGKAKPSTHGSG